jgi:signal transduction histidine kinase
VLDRIKKLSDTVENMLFLARADSCSHPPGRREIDLASVLCEIGDTFEMSAEAKDIELRVDLQRPLLLTANAEWIKLAFANLFDNAIKYTPRKGRVSVSAESKEGEVIVCISDTGPGIEDSQKKKIFDRFYRSRDGAYGSGLGLSITRRVFELHEGRIIERGKPGEGAVFEVRLRR